MHWTSALYPLALAATGVAFIGSPADPEPYRMQPATAAASCGLPVAKQVKAVKSFAEMLPVFRHPRCINCHGAVNPLGEEHRGRDQLDAEIDPMGDRERFLAQCQDCHDGLPGWRTPGEPVFFTGKDDEALCLQMKRFERTGESFVEHIENDHHDIQFIAAGFAGDRALGEGLGDIELVVEPPPGTQADLTAKARRWVESLDGHYGDSPECGCVVPGIKLKVRHTTLLQVPNGLPSKEASEVEFEVKLLPMGEDKPGGYQGEVSLVRTIQLTVPQFCTARGSREERWVFYAMLPPDSDSLTVWRFLRDDDPVGGIECRHGAGTAKITHLFPGTPVSQLGDGEPLLIPSDAGSTRELTLDEAGGRESLTITVLEVPAGE
ncbi:MAG: hypothetical protein ABJC36_12735 [Gemmatimonadales bacterium]